MAMSRKDYVAIADGINTTFHEFDEVVTERERQFRIAIVAEIMDSIQRAGNRNIDRSKFIQAAMKGL